MRARRSAGLRELWRLFSPVSFGMAFARASLNAVPLAVAKLGDHLILGIGRRLDKLGAKRAGVGIDLLGLLEDRFTGLRIGRCRLSCSPAGPAGVALSLAGWRRDAARPEHRFAGILDFTFSAWPSSRGLNWRDARTEVQSTYPPPQAAVVALPVPSGR